MTTKRKTADIPADETKEQRFVRVATPRMNRTIKSIAQIGSLGGSQYAKSPEQIETIRKALTEAVSGACDRLSGKKPEAAGFTF